MRRWNPLRPFLCLLLALGLAGCGGSHEGVRKRFDLALRQGALPADQQLLRIHQGDEVILRWTTDEPALIHLHGYDLEMRLSPGATATMSFVAHAAGRFPLMRHGHGEGTEVGIGYLEVYPR